MGKFSFDNYRSQWPRVGAVTALAVAGITALGAKRMSKPQRLAALNLAALMAHQYEEYVDPGWFPGQFNHGLAHSNQPRNYPLNQDSALVVNVAFGYPFYLAPLIFSKTKWLGLAPAMFGIAQAVAHGVVFPRRTGDKYSPGFFTAALLHVPLGLSVITALREQDGLDRCDYLKGALATVTFAVIGIAGPILVGRDKNSPHAFTEAQMGPHTGVPGSDSPTK